jgi:hypothetical protein
MSLDMTMFITNMTPAIEKVDLYQGNWAIRILMTLMMKFMQKMKLVIGLALKRRDQAIYHLVP